MHAKWSRVASGGAPGTTREAGPKKGEQRDWENSDLLGTILDPAGRQGGSKIDFLGAIFMKNRWTKKMRKYIPKMSWKMMKNLWEIEAIILYFLKSVFMKKHIFRKRRSRLNTSGLQ